jgi:4a-hydroxytetrahydrobiopterin dehydratase
MMSKAGDRSIVAPEVLEAFLKEHPQWIAQGEAQGLTLRRRYPFSAYLRGLGFVNAAAEHAEAVDHHPDLTLGYRWVVAVLTTHVSRGVSQMDLDLAEALDRIHQDHL